MLRDVGRDLLFCGKSSAIQDSNCLKKPRQLPNKVTRLQLLNTAKAKDWVTHHQGDDGLLKIVSIGEFFGGTHLQHCTDKCWAYSEGMSKKKAKKSKKSSTQKSKVPSPAGERKYGPVDAVILTVLSVSLVLGMLKLLGVG